MLILAIDDIFRKILSNGKKLRELPRKKIRSMIDFEGKIDGEGFEGNESKDFKLILGSKSMIPGFEDNLIGKKSAESIPFHFKQISLKTILKKI